MANTLLINKLTGGYFQFVLNGDTTNAVRGIKNDLLAVGNQLHFKTGNGANIIKEQFIYPADLTIVASGTFTFTNVDQVWTKLIEIGYFDWISSGGGGGGATRFDDLLDTFKYTGKDGQVVIVNESQQKLQTIPLYNYRKFTELEDTPDLLIANKMVATNEAGTALVFKNLPEDPVNYLNSIGFFDYNDLATQSTPISVAANTDVKLTNDTLGAFTNISYPPYGVSSLWDATTNRFNFTQLSIGDTIDVRIHLQVTTTTSNQSYKIGAKFGIGSASVFDNIIYSDQVKTAGVHEVSFVAPFYIGEANILNNPAELYINSDATASVKVDGWYIRILRRNINIVNVETGVDDATTTVKGIVRLAGDLAGTATNPTVPELANKALKSTTITINGTTFDLSANREWTITGSANWGSIGGVLLNQTDLQTALNNKQNSSPDLSSIAGLTGTTGLLRKTAANTYSLDTNSYALDSEVVKLTGTQTIGGAKTFENGIRFDSDLHLKQDNIISTPSGYTTFSAFTNGFNVHNGAGRQAIFGLANTSTLRQYQFPDGDGTFALTSDLATKQNTLVSGTNIKTINGNSLLGSGDLVISGGGSTEPLEFNTTDRTVWNNGKGNVATNTSFGEAALKSNTSGTNNIAYGGSSLLSNTTGSYNVALGGSALLANTIGGSNIAIGDATLVANTTGNANVAVGSGALGTNTTGLNNAALGAQAGGFAGSTAVNNTTSSDSVFIGANTRPLAINQTNQIVIGNSTIGHGSNTVTLGNSSIVTTILRGNVGIGTTSPSEKLHLKNTVGTGTFIRFEDTGGGGSYVGTRSGNIEIYTGDAERMRITSGGNLGIGTTSPATRLDVNGAITASGGFFNSDIRLKDLIDYDYSVSDIKPITYFWKDGRDNKKHVGYSAQEVQKLMPDAVNEGADGMLSVNYIEVLVAKIAELENTIKQIEKLCPGTI